MEEGKKKANVDIESGHVFFIIFDVMYRNVQGEACVDTIGSYRFFFIYKVIMMYE